MPESHRYHLSLKCNFRELLFFLNEGYDLSQGEHIRLVMAGSSDQIGLFQELHKKCPAFSNLRQLYILLAQGHFQRVIPVDIKTSVLYIGSDNG